MSKQSAISPSSYQVDTLAAHHRQILWQIWIPVGISLATIISLGVLVSVGTAHDSLVGVKWAGISLVFLIIPTFLAGLIVLASLGLAVYGLGKLLKVLPLYSMIARTYFFRAAVRIHQGLDQVVRPVIAVQGWLAGLKRLLG